MTDAPLQPPGDACTRFSLAWHAGTPPRIESYLNHEQRQSESGLACLVEIVLIDLEQRWRAGEQPPISSTAPRGEVDALPRVEEYVKRFPELAQRSDAIRDLAIAEYKLRHQFGAPPAAAEFAKRFPQLPDLLSVLHDCDLERELSRRQEAVHVAVSTAGQPHFSRHVELPLQFGRQSEGEPPPYSYWPSGDMGRVIVAARGERHVSRSNVLVRRDTADHILLENSSQSIRVFVEGHGALEPSNQLRTGLPVVFQVGDRVVRIEPRLS